MDTWSLNGFLHKPMENRYFCHLFCLLESSVFHSWSALDVFAVLLTFSFLFYLPCLFRFHFECRECPLPLYSRLKINAGVGQFRVGQSSWERCRRGTLLGTDLIRMPSAGPVRMGWMFLHSTNLCLPLVFMTYIPGRLWA